LDKNGDFLVLQKQENDFDFRGKQRNLSIKNFIRGSKSYNQKFFLFCGL
jgi:hypothetical protein